MKLCDVKPGRLYMVRMGRGDTSLRTCIASVVRSDSGTKKVLQIFWWVHFDLVILENAGLSDYRYDMKESWDALDEVDV